MLILCATDLLPKSEAAVERAGMMARQLGARLCIVHVVPSEREERKARIALAQVERRLRSKAGTGGAAPSVILRSGNPAQQLVSVVQQTAPDLIVLGPRQRHSLRARLGEALAERILSVRRCPLLIVRRASAGDYRSVLLALDLSSAAQEILRTAESFVLNPGVDTSVIHAFEPRYGTLPYIPRGIESVGAANSSERAEAERGVRSLLREHADGHTDYKVILSAAFPAEAIVSSVTRTQPDLLVMGTRGYGRVRRALLGSTTAQVVDAIACDVLLVAGGAKGQGRWRSPPDLCRNRTESRLNACALSTGARSHASEAWRSSGRSSR